MTKPIRSILRWPGSKRRLLPKLLPLIPAHVCYAEHCGGSLALLLAKDRSKVEIVNDVNGDLVALYRNLQHHLPELLREMDFLFSSRQNLKDFVQQPGITEIQRAARFLLKNRTSFGGNMDSFAVARTAGGGAAFSRKKQTDLLGAMHDRLDNVVIENLPYDRCAALYDSKDTFHFFDPPYVGASIKAYSPWTQKDVVQLRKNVDRLKGRWLVTINDSEANREIFSDCRVEAVTSASGSVNHRTHGGQTFTELIITP